MNLWVKRTGQLFMAALFLVSCEDETYLLGDRPEGKFNVVYREFIIGEGSIRADSAYTDNLTGTQRLLVGEYFDPEIGTIRTEAFAEFLPASTAKLNVSPSSEYIYDSLVIQYRLDFYSYGLANESVSKFKIHRITGETLTYVNPNDSSLANRYTASSTVGYDPVELGEAAPVTYNIYRGQKILSPTVLNRATLEAGKDTILIRGVLPKESAFGQELFNVALNDAGSEFSDNKLFRSRFKGLALTPSEGSAVLGLSINAAFSKVVLHYHSTSGGVNKDTLAREFNFNGVSFHNISATRLNGLPATDPPYTGVSPATFRVVESGAPLLTKIDLEPFYSQFADTLGIDAKPVINSAELVVESVSSEDGFEPIPNFELRVLKEDDSYANRQTNDSVAMSGYNLITDGQLYFVSGDLTTNAAHLAYNKSKGRYSGFPTLFMQSLLDNRNKQTGRIRYLGLFPATGMTKLSNTTSVGKYVDRTVFSKQNVKLRIYYTYPNKQNL